MWGMALFVKQVCNRINPDQPASVADVQFAGKSLIAGRFRRCADPIVRVQATDSRV